MDFTRENMGKTALVAGVTGIQGNELSRQLAASGWTVYGLARRPKVDVGGVTPIAADLNDAGTTRAALKGLAVSHVFYC